MSAHYVDRPTQQTEESPRRIRVFGAGNGITTSNDNDSTSHYQRENTEINFNGWIILLLFVLVFASFYQHEQISKAPGFQSGLIYDLNYLDAIIWGLMAFLSFTFTVIYQNFLVHLTRNGLVKLLIVLLLPLLYIESFKVAFEASGGVAHLQANEAHRFCEKEHNLKTECEIANEKIQGLSRLQRRVLAKSQSIQERLKQQQIKLAGTSFF